MKKIWECRRTFIAVFGIACMTYIGINNGVDTTIAISGAVAALVAGNAYERTHPKS